ncbi:hypothetical protein Glove_275g44 [Diversispora epigaea]|uniref:Uncharacterized protein n=1 Tax=Diversispora epigaea TaxID=1348612 RepID=A0A397I8M7_9GLOM|nr:hypothetical protein Glove_275g44 [Diversispora epigaea]
MSTCHEDKLTWQKYGKECRNQILTSKSNALEKGELDNNDVVVGGVAARVVEVSEVTDVVEELFINIKLNLQVII